MPRKYKSDLDRILVRVRVDANGCWVWTGHIQPEGYGCVRFRKVVWLAHRASYVIHRGEIPEGRQLDHLCRNRACVNPDHLEVVTQHQNMRRGKIVRLTAEQVIAIRSEYTGKKNQFDSGVSQKALARKYGVSRGCINHVVRHESWKKEMPNA